MVAGLVAAGYLLVRHRRRQSPGALEAAGLGIAAFVYQLSLFFFLPGPLYRYSVPTVTFAAVSASFALSMAVLERIRSRRHSDSRQAVDTSWSTRDRPDSRNVGAGHP
jgi:hypothetical protein